MQLNIWVYKKTNKKTLEIISILCVSKILKKYSRSYEYVPLPLPSRYRPVTIALPSRYRYRVTVTHRRPPLPTVTDRSPPLPNVTDRY